MSMNSFKSGVLDEIFKDHIHDTKETPAADPTTTADASTTGTSSVGSTTSDTSATPKKRSKLRFKWTGDYKPTPVQYSVPVNSNMVLKETSELLRSIFGDFVGTRAEWHACENSNNQSGTFVVIAKFIFCAEDAEDGRKRAIQSKIGAAKEIGTDAISILNQYKFSSVAKNNDVFLTDDVKDVLEEFVPDAIGTVNEKGVLVKYDAIKNNNGSVNWGLITNVAMVPNPANYNQKIYEVTVRLDGLKLYKEILKHSTDAIIEEAHKDEKGKEIPRKTKYDGWTVQLIREWEGQLRTDLYDTGNYQDINVVRMKAILQNDPAAKNVAIVLNQGIIVAGVPLQGNFV